MSERRRRALELAGAELALRWRDDMEFRQAAAIAVAEYLRAMGMDIEAEQVRRQGDV